MLAYRPTAVAAACCRSEPDLEDELMMKLQNLSAAYMAIAIALVCAFTAVKADEPKSDNKLIGTWKCISAKYDGQEVQRPEGFTQIKHVTPTQFTWLVYDKDGKVSDALGGGCATKGNEYIETPEYGIGAVLEQLKGKPQVFTWKIDGDKWHHNGKLSSGLTIEEVWQRVEKK
jgi:hypothetical protein